MTTDFNDEIQTGMRAMEWIFKMGFNSDFCDWYATIASGNAVI